MQAYPAHQKLTEKAGSDAGLFYLIEAVRQARASSPSRVSSSKFIFPLPQG
jgi:hypothetical protein